MLKVCEQDTSMFDDKSDEEIEALYDRVYGGVSPWNGIIMIKMKQN